MDKYVSKRLLDAYKADTADMTDDEIPSLDLSGYNSASAYKESIGFTDAIAIVRTPSSVQKTLYNYIYFDTDNLYSLDITNTKMKWLINDGIPANVTGVINLSNKMRNISMMRLGRVSFYSTSSVANINRIGFGIDEFSTQCILIPPTMKLHFIVQPDVNADVSETLVSSFFQNRGWFRFEKLFQTVDSLTLSMWNIQTGAAITFPPKYTTATVYQMTPNAVIWAGGVICVNVLLIDPAIFNLLVNTAYGYGPVIMGNFTTDDPLTDANIIYSYNSTVYLTKVFDMLYNGYVVVNAPIDISGTDFSISGSTVINVRITYQSSFSRMTGVIELVSEDYDD